MLLHQQSRAQYIQACCTQHSLPVSNCVHCMIRTADAYTGLPHWCPHTTEGVQMVLEPCLAELLHSGHINFGVACITKLLDAHLIDASKRTKLCQAVRLLLCCPAQF